MSEGYTPGNHFKVMDSPYLQRQHLRVAPTVQYTELQSQVEQSAGSEKAKRTGRGPNSALKKKRVGGGVGEIAPGDLAELNQTVVGRHGLPQVLTEHLASVPYQPSSTGLLDPTAPAIHRHVDAHLNTTKLSVRAGHAFMEVPRSNNSSRHIYSHYYVPVDAHHEPRTVTSYPIAGSDVVLVSPSRATIVEMGGKATGTENARLTPGDLLIVRERRTGWRALLKVTLRRTRPLMSGALKNMGVALIAGSQFVRRLNKTSDAV